MITLLACSLNSHRSEKKIVKDDFVFTLKVHFFWGVGVTSNFVFQRKYNYTGIKIAPLPVAISLSETSISEQV